MKRIVIVGGGISGLATAYYTLKKAKAAGADVSVQVLEAGPGFGGKITTVREAGFIVEGGPDSFISLKPEAIDLCEELGMADELVCTDNAHKRTFILCAGRLEEIPEGMESMAPSRFWPFAMTGLLSVEAKLRVLGELFVPVRRADTDESVADFIERRLGPEFYRNIAEPLLSGIYAGDARTLSLRATLPRLAEMEKAHGSLTKAILAARRRPAPAGAGWTTFVTLKGGVARLVERLVSVLELEGAALQSRSPVASLQRAHGGYVVTLEGGAELQADVLVLATPAYESARLLRGIDGRLAAEMEQIHYNPAATVSLAYPRDRFPNRLDGFGFVVPRAEGRALLACTWTSSKYPGRTPDGHVLLRGYLGSNRRETWQKLTDEQLGFLVREDLGGILGIWQEPVFTRVFRWERAMPQYGVGHLKWAHSVTQKSRSHPGLYLTGAAYRGVGIPDCVKDALQTADLLIHTPA